MNSKKGNNDFQPIIIIGAARSGTNMLRDLITQVSNFGTWDCDEINPIWYHGNKNHENDVFTKKMATPKVKRFIQNEFRKISKSLKVHNVVEKSCANSLKVPFINEIFPNAKFVFIYRDGRDSTASGLLEWTKRPGLIYTLKKVRYVPLSDLPYYVFKFGKNHLTKFFNNEKRLSFYGVNIPNIQTLLKKYSLAEISSLQWKESVEHSLRGFNDIDKNRIFTVKYEDITSDPKNHFKQLLEFLEADTSQIDLESLVKNVSTRSIGKYKKQFNTEERKKIEKLIGDTLSKLDYPLEFN